MSLWFIRGRSPNVWHRVDRFFVRFSRRRSSTRIQSTLSRTFGVKPCSTTILKNTLFFEVFGPQCGGGIIFIFFPRWWVPRLVRLLQREATSTRVPPYRNTSSSAEASASFFLPFLVSTRCCAPTSCSLQVSRECTTSTAHGEARESLFVLVLLASKLVHGSRSSLSGSLLYRVCH